jgi:hypothetical protein
MAKTEAAAKSKKPRRKGLNSPAAISRRKGLESQASMLARSCVSTFKDVQIWVSKKVFAGAERNEEGYVEDTDKYAGLAEEMLGGLVALPELSLSLWKPKKKEIRSEDEGDLKKSLAELQKHQKELSFKLKSLRPPREGGKKSTRKPRGE